MPNFIELLIESQQRMIDIMSPPKRQPQLNHQAVLLYDQTWQEAKNYNSHLQTEDKWGEVFAAVLSKKITEDLEAIDWMVQHNCDDIVRALNAWQFSTDDPAFKQCQAVREVLIKLVPIAPKKQKLLALCQEYKLYLKADIEKRLQRDHPLVYEHYTAHRRDIASPPPGAGLMPILIIKPGKNMERFIARNRGGLRRGKKSLNTAIKKYAVVSALEKTLIQPKPLPTQLADFHWKFHEQRAILNKDRDTALLKFVKGIVTLFSAGIAVAAGMWSVKGKIFGNQLHSTLKKPAYSPLPLGRG